MILLKDGLSQKNAWKYDIFFKCSKKVLFPKNIALEYDLSCIIRKDGISFYRKYDIFSRRKVKDDLSLKIRGNMIFGKGGVPCIFGKGGVSFSYRHEITLLSKEERLSSPEKYT